MCTTEIDELFFTNLWFKKPTIAWSGLLRYCPKRKLKKNDCGLQQWEVAKRTLLQVFGDRQILKIYNGNRSE